MDSRDPFGPEFHGFSQLRGFEDLDLLAEPEDPEDELLSQRDGQEEVDLAAQAAEFLPGPAMAILDDRGNPRVEPQLHIAGSRRGVRRSTGITSDPDEIAVGSRKAHRSLPPDGSRGFGRDEPPDGASTAPRWTSRNRGG